MNYTHIRAVCAAVLISLLPVFASAATILGEQDVIGGISTSFRDDVYATGEQIRTNPDAAITGDFVTAGGQIAISGPVSQDVIAAAGEITLSGTVGDDVRAAAGTFDIDTTVRDDLFVAAGQITAGPNTEILGDTYITGGQIVLGGSYGGTVEIAAEEVTIDAVTAGDVVVRGAVITVGQNAFIAGDLVYPEGAELIISDQADIRGDRIAKDFGWSKSAHAAALAGLVTAMGIVKVIGMAIAVVVLAAVFVRMSASITKTALASPWKSLGLGAVFMIAKPIALIIIASTLIGIPLALLGFATYFVIVILGCMYGAIILGTWIRSRATKHHTPEWKWALLGVLVITLIKLVPIVGWIIALGIHWIGIGAIGQLAHKKIWTKRK